MNNDVIRDVYAFIQTHLPLQYDTTSRPEAPIQPKKAFRDMTAKELKEAIALVPGLSRHTVGFVEKADYVALLEMHYNKEA